MTTNAHDVEQALLALSREERAAVIQHALQSLELGPAEADQTGVDRAWQAEIRRRFEEVESGETALRPADEVFAELRADLARQQP
ncbi:addiction module protein [Granulicoccus phenolivorans]|uniref:addiction module protein n=1 Tax=Granulicoccus phenolivorans TaxID=266854 RepID=UPI000479DA68|nr:addiction module protein [Granulicoccus phenolivorans]